MKKLLFLLLLTSTQILRAQCEVNVSASPSTTIVCGESVTLSAFGSSTGQLVLDEDFNTGGFGTGWSSTPGAVNFSNPCSPGGVDGTTHAWMDNNTSVPRALTSASYDLSTATAGVTICFDMLFAEQGNAAPCEGPDEPDEGVYLQYSIDGGATWIDIHYFDPNGGNDPQLTNWNNWCFAVPAAGITSNTMFQWYQEADSGADYDHWGIDNVQIFVNDINSELEWLHDGYSYGLGNPGGENPNPVTPTSTTTYTAQITTGTGQVCTQNIEIVVVPPIYDVNITATPATICSGDCAVISGTAQIIQDPGGIETYENNEFSLVASGSASVNINVQGINTNSIYDGLIQNVTINGFDFSGSFFCTSFGGCDCNGTNIAFGQTCNLDASGFTVTLTSPGGCTIILAPSGVANGNYSNTVFVPVGGTAFGPGFPNGGTWSPQESFSNLNGCDPNGVWTLSFDAPGLGLGIGTLFGWSITFDDPPIFQPVCSSWSPTTGLSNPSSITTDACPTTSTNYTLTVTNCTPGCPTYDEVIAITVDPCGGCIPPNQNIIPVSVCSPATADLGMAIGAGSDPATLIYFSSQTDAQNNTNPISNLVGTSGSYWVRAEDPTDPTCFQVYEIVVTVSSLSYTASVSSENCGAGDGQISITASAGSGNYTYSINGGATSQSSGTFSGLSANSYNILVSDVTTGCTITGSEVVGNIGGPTINSLSTVDPSCAGVCDGSITANVSGGTPPYTYQWYDGTGNPIGTNSSTITGLCAGSFSVEVSDASGVTTQLFYDDFESGTSGWTLNVPMGMEGADPNYFVVNDNEGGVAVGGCGIANNGDATLHITSVFNPTGGAAYDAGGLCGFLFCPMTDRQAETPLINTVGQTGLTLNFDFIANGDIPNDQATVWYNDGGGWFQLGAPLLSGTGACFPQGIWTAFSSPLPASCENIPNLQIAIRWQNNDDAAGSDPSVAINNIEIVTSGSSACTVSQTATLTDPVPADASFTLTDFCVGDINAASNVLTTGGTFVFNPAPGDGSSIDPATGTISNGVVGTTYTVQYTTPAPCSVSTTQTVTVNGFTYSATVTDENCGLGDGEISLTTNGGTGTFDFSIDNGVTSQTSGTFTGLSSGTYQVLITDANSCSASGNEVVANIGGPTISSFNITDPSCAGICDGSLTITVTGGVPPYTYAWTDASGNPIGTNSSTLSNVCAGDYSVTVTDANGGGTQLNTNSDFESGTGAGCDCPTGYTCNNDAGQVFDGVHPLYAVGSQGCVTGATNYSSSLGANSGTGYIYFYAGADNISSGSYTFAGGETVELCVFYSGPQGAGASGQNTANSHFSFGVDGVQVGPDVPVPTNTGWTQFCFTVTMTAGNHTFQILSGGAAQYSIWFDDFTITQQGSGGATCPVSDTYTLIDPAPADPTFVVTDFCSGEPNGATGIITPGGIFDFNPNPADGSTIDPVTGEITNGIVGSTYTVQYTTPGACPVTSTNTVSVNGISYTAVITNENCNAGDGEISLTVNGGSSNYEYSIDNGTNTQTTGLFNALSGGSFNVLITDLTTGCSVSGTEIILNNGAPSIDLVNVTDESCLGTNDGSIDVVTVSGGSGNYSYSWDIVPDPGTAQVSNLASGNYTVTVTDINTLCTTSSTLTINAGVNCCDLTVDNISTTDITCNGADNGELTATYTGGIGSVTISIDNGTYTDNNTSGVFTALPPGIYTVVFVDANGCTDQDQITINEPTQVDFTPTTEDVSCFGSTDGSISISPSGGASPYQYSIDNGVTWSLLPDFTNLAAGNYDILVQDDAGCLSGVQTEVINEPTQIQLTVNTTDESCYNTCDGSVSFVPSGGSGSYQYTINGSLVTANESDLCGGTYNYTVADDSGCSLNGTFEVIPAVQITIDDLIVTDDDCEQNCVGMIQVSSSSAATYTLNGMTNSNGLFINLCSDSYSIILTDANGCQVSTSAIVNSGVRAEADFNVLPGLVTILDAEFQVINTSSNADSYLWEVTGPQNYSYTDQSEEFSLELPPVEGGYSVCLIAYNSGGCPDTLCQSVLVKDEFLLFVPNAFTPNGDEYNNFLQIYATGIDQYSFNMQIWNRWGELVWETNDITYFWDGTYNGQVVQDGTYTWKIVIKDPYTDERRDYVGHLNVLK